MSREGNDPGGRSGKGAKSTQCKEGVVRERDNCAEPGICSTTHSGNLGRVL
jgi:hypothetical protein